MNVKHLQRVRKTGAVSDRRRCERKKRQIGRLQKSTKSSCTHCNDLKICFPNDYENGCQSLEKQITVEKFLSKVFTPGLALLQKWNYQDTWDVVTCIRFSMLTCLSVYCPVRYQRGRVTFMRVLDEWIWLHSIIFMLCKYLRLEKVPNFVILGIKWIKILCNQHPA